MKDQQVRNHQPFEHVPSPLYIPIFTNFAQALFLVDAISCLFLIASIIFLGHGPSSSYWTEEGCKRLLKPINHGYWTTPRSLFSRLRKEERKTKRTTGECTWEDLAQNYD